MGEVGFQTVLSERRSESVRYLSGLKDMFHVLDQFVISSRSAESEEAAACWSQGWTDGTAGGGIISKEIKRIFQRVGEIIDENQKKNRAQNATLRNSSLDRNQQCGHLR